MPSGHWGTAMNIAIIGAGNVGPGHGARARGHGILSIALQIQHGWPWQKGWKLIGATPERKPT
jgi:hypothetical protein